MKKLDVLIIGAGQAGLALGYHLKKSPLQFRLVDGNSRVGDSWRQRYDSLSLFTPRWLSVLSGLAIQGDPQGYPGRDEFANYLECYAEHFDLPVDLNRKIQKLERVNSHFCAVSSDGQEYEAKVIVLASGGFQKPVIPSLSRGLSACVRQFSAGTYKNPSQIPAGEVVVVGDGATGRDLAVELSASHTVYLAAGKPRRLVPERIAGVSIWWWFKRLGMLTAPSEGFVGRKMRDSEVFPNRQRDFPALRQIGVNIVPRLTQADGSTVTFADGTRAEVSSAIWAVGYRDDSEWVHIPEVKDARGNFIHRYGVSPVRNLYFIGRQFQMTSGSARVYGVARDAKIIATEVLKSLS